MQIEEGIDKFMALQRMAKEGEKYMAEKYPNFRLIQQKIGMDDLERVLDSVSIDPFVIIIDHLLLMKSERWDEFGKIAELTATFKDFAMQHRKIFISISQVSRQADRQEALDLHSGKGNSSIESDSDTVILLHRTDRKAVWARLQIAKDREGQFFDRTLSFNGATLQFTETKRVPYGDGKQMEIGKSSDEQKLESIRKNSGKDVWD